MSRVSDVLIDGVTYAGSAFGVLIETGEQVFLNKRIVEKIGLVEDQVVRATLIPNYEDKKQNIPWRAIHVEVDTEGEAAPEPEPTIDNTQRILALLDEHGPLRTSTIAKEIGLTVDEAGTLCMGMFASKKIAMADVYAEPGQKRASLRVWGLHINDFDVDVSTCDD